MRLAIIIFMLTACAVNAQVDKLFFKNGETKKGIIVSMGSDFVFFKSSDTSASTQRIPKSEILIVEKYDGKIYVFAKKSETIDTTKNTNIKLYRNSFGVQPFGFLLGRLTGSYEILNKNGTVGVVIPLSVTFDPVGVIYQETADSTSISQGHSTGFNIISGADVNFYIGRGDFEGFYFGPRVRYGVDKFLYNIEAYSIQTQFGWRLGEPEDRLVHHVSVGLGFVRILSSPGGNRISPKQSYGWASINYRVALKW